MVVLRNDPLVRESMKYNKLTGRIDIVKKLWWNEEVCKLDDDGRTYFYYFFERYYKLTSEKCMDKALRIEANSRAYHPICEYLEQLEWDGQERIRYVLQRYMGADASDFVYEVVKHFLMEALSRIYRPGCKADEMLCLVGQQGAGKSTFFRFLALNDDWFSDDLKQLNDSKIYEHLRGHWIMEMSEMIAAISAKSNEEIKSFLTRQKDTYRKHLLKSPQEIYEAAYQIALKNDIAECFSEADYSPQAAKALLKSPNLLNDIYAEWIETDYSHMEDLRQTIADFKDYMVKTEKILSGKER